MENEKLLIQIENDILTCRFEKGGAIFEFNGAVDEIYKKARKLYRHPERMDKSWVISRYAESSVKNQYRISTMDI